MIMAKDFSKAGSVKRINEVVKISEEKANIIAVKMIKNDILNDYPNNSEDITYTEDLENSIRELGFTDPIEVTCYGQPDGQYMIVSGHRRRAAGVKCGVDMFPCVIKVFDSEFDVDNYVLLANCQRDSSKDPLLFCVRYKMHETYLKKITFKGNIRREIAKRLGLSTQQADRYNQMNKIIAPIWELVRDEKVGMSSVLYMSSFKFEEQEEIYNLFKEYLNSGGLLTQENVRVIIENYRIGGKDFVTDIEKASVYLCESEIDENRGKISHDDVQEISALVDGDIKTAEKKILNGDKKIKTEQAEERVKVKNVVSQLENLNTLFNSKFKDIDNIDNVFQVIGNTFEIMIDEMHSISKDYFCEDIFKTIINKLEDKIKNYR